MIINNEYFNFSKFPEITKLANNSKIVKKLIDAYAGSKSELTAICQYTYESFITKNNLKYAELSQILEKISICEMKHLEILSKLLIKMDVDPKLCRYIDNNYNLCNYWSTGNIKYIKDVDEFLKYNIEQEKLAIKEYEEIIKTSKDETLNNIISLIISDEKKHINILNAILSNNNNNTRTSQNTSLNDDNSKEENLKADNNDNIITDTTSDSTIKEIKKENIEKTREIVNIFNASNNNITKKDKGKEKDKFKDKKKYNEKNNVNNDNENVIQIPVSDITNISNIERNYIKELENKIYPDDEIVDG